jgi:hypothetical protein
MPLLAESASGIIRFLNRRNRNPLLPNRRFGAALPARVAVDDDDGSAYRPALGEGHLGVATLFGLRKAMEHPCGAEKDAPALRSSSRFLRQATSVTLLNHYICLLTGRRPGVSL